MNDTSQSHTPTNNSALQLSWRTLAILLLIVLAVTTYLWKPWEKPASVRTITIQGAATVSAVPDTYAFQPIFEHTDLKKVTATGNDAVAALKKLGVKDADIKTTISSGSSIKPMAPESGAPTIQSYPIRGTTSTYSITATVHDKVLAQKVSDYLATTTATGLVTPSASFSKGTRTKLDLTARSQAADDAKAKAEVTAKQLGARVGKVVKISETTWGGIYATDAAGSDVSAPQAVKSTGGPTIEPGTNEVSYSFTVEFELK